MGPFELNSGETIEIERFGQTVDVFLIRGRWATQLLASYTSKQWEDMSGYDLVDYIDTSIQDFRRRENGNG